MIVIIVTRIQTNHNTSTNNKEFVEAQACLVAHRVLGPVSACVKRSTEW